MAQEATITCRKLTTPPYCLGGREHPYPDFVNLPRPNAPPQEKTKKKLTKHIREDALKDIVYQMYSGEFIAKFTYVKTEDGHEELTGEFGVSSSSSSPDGQAVAAPYNSEFLIGQVFYSIPTESTIYFTTENLHSNEDFAVRLGSEHEGAFLLQLWHHALRQHASSLSSEAMMLALNSVLGAYVSFGDSMLESLVDAVVVAADSVLLRQDVATNVAIGNNFSKVGEYLESKAMFAAAAAMYEVATRLVDEPIRLAVANSYTGLAHKRNHRYDLSEASYIKALQYHAISNGNALNFCDNTGQTQNDFHNLLAMYSHLCHSGRGAGSDEDKLVQQAVVAILLMGGYQPRTDSMPNYKLFLKKEQRNRAKARQLFTRAVLSGNTRDFRQICLSAKTGSGVVSNVTRDTARTAEQSRQLAMQSASKDYQSGPLKPMMLFARCAYCNASHKDDDSCKLMRCPCKAVAYCKKECQVSHWPEHKKLCAHHLKKKKGARKT